MAVMDHDRRLSEALASLGYPESVLLKARQGYWSDFSSPLALPKMELLDMLEIDGHDALAGRVVNGEFDG